MDLALDVRTRWELCLDSLHGLSVGDALGAQFLLPGRSLDALRAGSLPAGQWAWTDDSEMAFSVAAELRERGRVDQDELAASFADRCEPYRGYGGGVVAVLHEIRDGVPWRRAAAAAFGGQGSRGNGAAMRVAPLGAYYADDLGAAAREAIRQAEVTHAHPEGVLGAALVAVAAGHAAASRLRRRHPDPRALLGALTPYLVDDALGQAVRHAGLLLGASVGEAAHELGNGAPATARDTVPFALWAAATHLDDYPAAVTACIEAGGDVDTTSAIVGGIVAAHTGLGPTGVPASWLDHREPFPAWFHSVA